GRKGPLVEMIATKFECGKGYVDSMTRSGFPCDRVENFSGEDDDRDYGAMLFSESLQTVLLNCEGEFVEGEFG
ncbi:hypothetical protein HAX54_050589, partial [Datura stramonium]|nr:hypothetical protein [Datura stramonium]